MSAVSSAVASSAACVRPALTRAFVWVFIGSLAVRLLWAAHAQITPISDAYSYDRMALHWVETGEFRSRILDIEYRVGLRQAPDAAPAYIAYRTPGYIAFLAAIYATCGHNWTAVAAAQAVLGALTSALLVLLAGRTVSRRVGITAGVLHALWPTAVVYVPMLAADNLAVFLVVAGLGALVAAQQARGRTQQWLLAMLSGLAGGAALLTRPVSLFFVPAWLLLALYDPLRRERKARVLACCAGAMILTVAPWLWRNHALGYGWTTISTQGGYALWWGNNWRSTDGGNPPPPREPNHHKLGELEQYQLYKQKARQWIRANPGRYLALSLVRLARHVGTSPDVFAAKYFFPTPENDELVCAGYWPKQYPASVVEAGRQLELRNRRWHQYARVVAAPLMLLAVALALARPRQFAYVLAPLACYVGGLSLTVVAGRYRLMSDPLFLVPLAALVCDLLFGSHDLGRWGGRGVKLALVVLAVGGSVALFVTGADRRLYTLGPGWEPNPPYAHLGPQQVRIDVQDGDTTRSLSSRTCATELTREPAGLNCRVRGSSDTSDHQYGGIRVPVRGGMNAVVLDVTWLDPECIQSIYATGRGEVAQSDGTLKREDILRWEWHARGRNTMPPDKRGTYVLTPDAGAAHFKKQEGGRGRTAGPPATSCIDEFRLVVRVQPTTSAGFILHDLAFVLPGAPRDAAAGRRVALSPADLDEVRRRATGGCDVQLTRTDSELRCALRAGPVGDEPATGGIRFRTPESRALELELSVWQAESLERVTVTGYDAEGGTVARWAWPMDARGARPVSGFQATYRFVPSVPSGYFEPRTFGEQPIVTWRVAADLRPNANSSFAIHAARVTLAGAAESAPSADSAGEAQPTEEPPDDADAGPME